MANAFSDIQKRYGSDNSNTNYSGGSAFADIVDKYGSDDVAPSSSNGGVLEYGKDFLENTGKSISNWYDNSKQALTNYSALQQRGLADGTMTEVPTYGTMDMFEGTPQYVITPGKEQTEEARQIRKAGQDAYNQVVGHPAMYATMTPYMPAPIRAVSGLLTLPTMVDDAVTTYDANSQQATEEGNGTGTAVLNTAKNLIVDPVLEPAKKWVTDPSGTLDEIREGGLGSAYDNVIMPFEIGKGAAKGAKYVGERVVPDSIQDRVSGPINSVKDTVSGAIDTAKTTGKNMFSDIREKFDSGKTTGAFDDIKETYGDNTPVEYPVENYIEDTASTEGDPTIYNAANPDDMRTAVYQRFKENGFTDTEAAALTGNIEAESGFDVNADSTVFDGNGSRGLVQFTGDRLDGLRRFAEENGSDPNDWRTQVDYATYELTRGNEQGALAAMRENPDATPEEMAVIVRKTYERPAEEYANDAARMDGARKAYNGESSHNNTPRNGASGNADSMAEIDALNKELDNAYNDSLKSVEDANKGLGDLNPDSDIHGVTIDENGSVKNNLNPYVEDHNATQYQVAWHGTGSKFNEFSNDFVGETNGQAHGYGTYFASDKAVSKQYRDFAKDKTGEGYLKKVDVPEDTEIIKGEYPLTSSNPQVIKNLESAIDNLSGEYKAKMIDTLKEKSGYTPNSYDFEKLVKNQTKAQEDLAKLQDYINADTPTTGQRIKANSVIRRLGDETPKETLSDKAKLEEYAEQLKQKFSNATKDIEEYKANGGKVDNDITPQMVDEKPSILLNDVIRNSNGFSGEMAYKLLRDVFDSPKMASEYLDKHGIKGMSYTNMSEGRNFVVFNPKNAKILEQDVQYMKAPGKNAVKTDNPGVNYRETSETGLTGSNNEFVTKNGVNTDFLDNGNRLSDMHTENSPWEYVEGKENLQSDTPVTRKELFKAINDGFTDLRSGHIKESGVRGYFKPQSGVVRVKTYGDFEAAAHELGHLIDRDYNFHSMEDVGPELMKGLRKRFGNSYNNLNMDGIKKEGWAEFFRSYTTNRARAAQDFPKTYRKFTSLLDTNKDLKDKVNKVATAMHKWYSQSPVDRAKGRITFGGEQTSIKEALSSTEPIKNALNRIYTDVVDNVHPLKQIVDIVEERTGQKLKLEDNPYLQAVLYRGTEGKAQAFLERSGDGHISYADILKDIPEKMHKDLSAYMVAMRDMDILRYNEKALMDNQVVQAKNKALSAKIKQVMDNHNLSASKKQAMVRKLESQKEKLKDTIYTDKSASEIKAVIDNYSKDPKLVKAQKLMVKYNNELLDKLVEGGLLSKEAVSEMRSKYPNYTPFSRDFGDTPNAQVFTGDTSFKNVSAPIKRMKGSARDVVDPLESIIKNTFKVFKEVERNKVAQSFVKLSKQPGMADIVEKLDDVDVKARDNSFFVLENGKKTGYGVWQYNQQFHIPLTPYIKTI